MVAFPDVESSNSALKLLCTMHHDDFELLKSKLESAPISAKTKDVVSHIGTFLELKANVLEDFIDVLVSLAKSTSEVSPKRMAERLFRVIEKHEELKEISAEDKNNLFSRLEELTQLKTLLFISKLNEVLYDNQRTFFDCRIITDVRTIFDNPENSPIAASLIHTIKFIFNEDFSTKEWFIALDDDDLSKLYEQITRARTKANSLRTMPKTELPEIN